MTEMEWLTCEDPKAMLYVPRLDFHTETVKGVTTRSRKLELLSTACCRHFEHALIDSRSLRALAVFEQYLDGEATQAERQAAADDANEAVASDGLNYGQFAAASAVCSALFIDDNCHPCLSAESMVRQAQRA